MINTVEHSTHSVLAPSKAHMWALCAGSLRMAKGVIQTPTEDAASGTCSHWILEQDLKGIAPAQSRLGERLQFDGFEFTVDQDRIDRVLQVVEVIKNEPGQRWVEQLLDMSEVYGVEGQSGHADIVTADQDMTIIHPETGAALKGIISVHDFKDGAGLVYAKNNFQGLSYGTAAMLEHDILFPWGGMRFCIHQPRMRHYDEWVYSRDEVAAFILAIRPAARLAFDLYNDTVILDEDKHLNPGYAQCHWCAVRGRCSKRAASMVARFAVRDVTEPLKLTDAQVAEYFNHTTDYEDWIRAIRAEAYRRAIERRGAIPGQKIVRGKRGARDWIDPKRAREDILLSLPPGVPESKLFKPQELNSPTVIEKLIGKQAYKDIEDNVTQAPGGLTLVPLHDRREEVVLERQDFAVIDTSDLT